MSNDHFNGPNVVPRFRYGPPRTVLHIPERGMHFYAFASPNLGMAISCFRL